ncbi:hypothetical protein CQA53_05870 [Helicobacter didelphidarum]|uniref:Uncharacterized protein n=1 Tax=Helicobacter didelphidarum TaxID=2040648 RepID=A0A3D8IKY9_9HELI|nr:hypothetical protein [Helicobacter didelphidarum]RDU65690.1 hypothetical protein CQA53_05870 [Helicobacter didelphidarum]
MVNVDTDSRSNLKDTKYLASCIADMAKDLGEAIYEKKKDEKLSKQKITTLTQSYPSRIADYRQKIKLLRTAVNENNELHTMLIAKDIESMLVHDTKTLSPSDYFNIKTALTNLVGDRLNHL